MYIYICIYIYIYTNIYCHKTMCHALPDITRETRGFIVASALEKYNVRMCTFCIPNAEVCRSFHKAVVAITRLFIVAIYLDK